MSFRVVSHQLQFKKPAKTSRDTMHEREVFYLLMSDGSGLVSGIGECAPIYGLSRESREEVLEALSNINQLTENPVQLVEHCVRISSLHFALESAARDLVTGGNRMVFPIENNVKIAINGLVWMNGKESMLKEARQKIEEGYTTIKLKIGGIDFQDEVDIIKAIRSEFKQDDLVIRLDANGAFGQADVMEKLDVLSQFSIHSVEQPIRAGQWEIMAECISKSPLPIALDEELIGINDPAVKLNLLDSLKPDFLVLKPSLHGSFSGCDEWIAEAEKRNIGWWATSALESNIGLNAIAQWVATKDTKIPQGLGTGALYTNNIASPLRTGNGYFYWDQNAGWELPGIFG